MFGSRLDQAGHPVAHARAEAARKGYAFSATNQLILNCVGIFAKA
jgi:hypothetical protein